MPFSLRISLSVKLTDKLTGEHEGHLPWNSPNPSKYTPSWNFLFAVQFIRCELREFQERSAATKQEWNGKK